jgi:iron(III) transport system ATP-binding protein
MRAELKRIQSEWGVTTVYVTHDQAEAMAISDRIAVLSQGRLMQIGSADEIYERPTSEFVASFIGRTNLFAGRLQGLVGADGYGVVESAVGPIRCSFRVSPAAGAEVKFVTRPENVEFVRGPDAYGENTFDGRVLSRVYLGEISEYTVTVGSMEFIVRSHPRVSIAPGEIVRVHLPADRTIAICD